MKTCLLFCFCLIGFLGISQTQEKNRPVVFENELFSQFPNVRDISIAFDHSEMYFTMQDYSGKLSFIGIAKHENNEWRKVAITSFSGKYKDLEPFLSPDGLKLYFASNRPLDSNSTKTKDFDIWYVQRDKFDTQWSEPIRLNSLVNSEYNEFYPAITNSGNLYFTSDKNKDQLDDIYVSFNKNGNLSQPIALGTEINTAGYEFNSYISPDESFLIFSGYERKDGQGGGDLYISFKNASNIWSDARNLGPNVNSSAIDYCPFYDMKYNMLYFTSRRNSVPARFEEPQTLNNIQEYFKAPDNGLSKFYKTHIDISTYKNN